MKVAYYYIRSKNICDYACNNRTLAKYRCNYSNEESYGYNVAECGLVIGECPFGTLLTTKQKQKYNRADA